MAVISNIFYNLTAWASGTFSVGDRRSSGGNAYQCTTGGTGTVAPTGTGTFIGGGGTVVWKYLAPVDYTDLQSWADALPATLTQAVVAQLWNTGPITPASGAPVLTLTGHTTTASNNITVTCAPGESFGAYLAANPSSALAFNTSYGPSIVLPATGTATIPYVDIRDDNVVWDSIPIKDPNSGSLSTLISGNANLVISNTIFDGYPQYNTPGFLALGNNSVGTTKLINVAIVDRSPTSGANTVVVINAWSNLAISGMTMWGVNTPATTIGILNQGAGGAFTNTVTDSIFIGYTSDFTIGSNAGDTWTADHLIISAASITASGVTVGAGMQYSQTAANHFVSASSSTPNLRLKGSSTAINAGATDTTINVAAKDILGTTRPQGAAWDIGAYEVPAALTVGSASGRATVSGTATAAIRTVGSASGQATVAGVSKSSATVGSASGQATVAGVGSAVAYTVGTASGQASVAGYNQTGSLGATITIDKIPPHGVNTPFTITGTTSIIPTLQFSDDTTGIFNPIPIAGITALGVQPFSFTHPGEPIPGSYQVIVTDTSTGASGTATYTIVTASRRLAAFKSTSFPPAGPPGLTKIIPSYLYQEYEDDDNLQALVQAQNAVAQSYLDWFNQTNLPIYTQLSGALLDWVAEGLYGMKRPNLTTSTNSSIGPFNTYQYDTLAMATELGSGKTVILNVTDDLFKRFITWNFYKGDGFTFNVPWLKRRVMRFLGGVNGVDYGVSETYQVSVAFVGARTINITISAGSQMTTYVPILVAAIGAGVCQLPLQYSYNILQS